MNYHFIITMLTSTPIGTKTKHFSGTFAPRPGMTRSEAFSEILEEVRSMDPSMQDAPVVFFSLEPDVLVPAANAAPVLAGGSS